jgi:hypothetical protein
MEFGPSISVPPEDVVFTDPDVLELTTDGGVRTPLTCITTDSPAAIALLKLVTTSVRLASSHVPVPVKAAGEVNTMVGVTLVMVHESAGSTTCILSVPCNRPAVENDAVAVLVTPGVSVPEFQVRAPVSAPTVISFMLKFVATD